MTSKPSTPQKPVKPPTVKTKRFFRRFILLPLMALMILGLMAVLATIAGYQYISEDLPKINSLMDYRPPIITTVYAEDGRKIGEFFKERRIVTPLAEVPPLQVKAFIAAEDSRFFQHQGVDPLSILRAALKNLEAGTIKQGGSTITQQVTRSFLLTPERSYIRKIKEVILSYRIEHAFSKDEILFLYLNQIYLGHGAYGVQAAAENYFGKSVKDLNLAECAILAGLPQAPTRYSPFRHPEQARARQVYVLNRMVEEGFITREQADQALAVKLDIKPRRNLYEEQVPYYTEHVRRYIEGKYGTDALYTQGLQIYTAVNIDFQKAAELEVNRGLREIDKRQGFRGPLGSLATSDIDTFLQEQAADVEANPLQPGRIVKAVVAQVNDQAKTVGVRIGKESGVLSLADMSWARKPNPEVAHYEARVRQPSAVLKPGDLIFVRIKEPRKDPRDSWHVTLEQEPLVQGALLCLETETGLVKAMVGGRDFNETQFNRAIQSRRQPGSSFKPIIYAAALDRKFSDPKKVYTPATVIIDSAVVFEDRQRDQSWKPKNYKETFYGPTLLREALAQSRNVVTVKILQDIGVDYAIDYARRLGVTSDLTRTLSLALGASGVSLFELTRAYSVFANQGFLVEPVFVLKIIDRDGKVIEEAVSERRKAIEKDTAFIMTSLMESVVQQGTGQRIKALGRPAAGKTGTTNDMYDAWYIGYTPEYITGVWVGFDNEAPLGKTETGAVAASPVWLGFMRQVLANESVKAFQAPEGVIFAKIDAETGLLPVAETRKTIFECFKEGTVPSDFSKRPGEVKEAEDFFKKDL
ncbi:MAG: PBP1A family penicillin-binding protein [Desulfobacterales bacterium]|jgi:penicillin-binding protein 1A|nr:PBP1A family penicillin-binding protein [Desulfobacterales bacterium]